MTPLPIASLVQNAERLFGVRSFIAAGALAEQTDPLEVADAALLIAAWLGEPVSPVDPVAAPTIPDGYQFQVSGGRAAWLPPTYVNARVFGAKGDGVTDDTTAIRAAIAAAVTAGRGAVFLPAGKYVFSGQLLLNLKGVYLVGAGRYATILQPKTSLTDVPILITADNCGVRDATLAYASSNSASNPAVAAGIQVLGARMVELRNLEFSGVNGYMIEVLASSTQMPLGAFISQCHELHCAGGIHLLGNNQGSNNFGMQTWITDCNLEISDRLDCLLIEDSNDVLMLNVNGAAAQGVGNTNSMLHIKGKCSTVYGANLDLGVYPGPASAPTVLIEAGTNGAPSDVVLRGTFQAGAPNVKITDGSRVSVEGTSKNASSHGAEVTNLSGPCFLDRLTFSGNNQAGAGATYDLQLSNAGNFVYCRNSNFVSPVNATPTVGSVIRPINDVAHRGVFLQCSFDGSGQTPSTVFQGTPQIVRGCRGYNPRGNITPPATPPVFGTAYNASQDDVSVVFQTIGGATGLRIGSQALGVAPVVGVPYRVPARQTIQVDGAGTQPTWLWIAD